MAVKVRWLKKAESELDAIWLYISENSPQNAAQIVVRIVQAARDLGTYPKSGHVVSEFGNDAIREYPVWPYRLVYRFVHDEVVILAIVHGARRMPDDIATRD